MPVELLPGESKQLDVQLTPVAGPGEVLLDRFFVLNIASREDADFQAHCWINNTGGAPVSHHLNMKGEVHYNKGQLIYRVDQHRDFTVQPGETYKYEWIWHAYPFDPAWLRVYLDDEPIMPRFDWIVGYSLPSDGPLVEVKATHVGTDWAILRYCQRSVCSRWDVYAYTPPQGAEEHAIRYPRLSTTQKWGSLDHLLMPLLSQRYYEGGIYGFSPGAAHRTGYDQFWTK